MDLLVDEQSIKVSHMTGQCVLAAEGYTKLCARWVLEQLITLVTSQNLWDILFPTPSLDK